LQETSCIAAAHSFPDSSVSQQVLDGSKVSCSGQQYTHVRSKDNALEVSFFKGKHFPGTPVGQGVTTKVEGNGNL